MVKKNKIAIQGIEGSFHHAVAQSYFNKSIYIECCSSFDDLVISILKNDSSHGVMAIENSIAGSIIPNYALIDQNNLNIVGEYYYQIQHSLLALPNQKIDDLLEVHSHPMALLQCKEFFSNHPNIKLVESDDTANAAKEIITNNIIKSIPELIKKNIDLFSSKVNQK